MSDSIDIEKASFTSSHESCTPQAAEFSFSRALVPVYLPAHVMAGPLDLVAHKAVFDKACASNAANQIDITGIIIDHVLAARRQGRERGLVERYGREHRIVYTGRTRLPLLLCKAQLGKNDKGASLRGRAIEAMIAKGITSSNIHERFHEISGGWDGWARLLVSKRKAADPKRRNTHCRINFSLEQAAAFRSGERFLVTVEFVKGKIKILQIEPAHS